MCEMKSTLGFGSFLSVFSFWDPYNVDVGVFNVVPEVSWVLFIFFSFFFLCSVLQQWFPPFCPPGNFSILMPQLFCCWFLLVYCSCLFFSSSRSLINISRAFSILFLRSWIIFTIIILDYFFWKVTYLHFISLFSWGFILSLLLAHNFLLFHSDELSIM